MLLCFAAVIKMMMKIILVFIGITNLLANSPSPTRNHYKLLKSKSTTILDEICHINHDSICVSELWNHYGASPDFLPFWLTLRGRANFQTRQMFRFARECNGFVDGVMKVVLRIFGVGKMDKKHRDVLLDVKKMKRVLRCPVLENKERRMKRNAVINTASSTSSSTVCWPFWRGDGYCDLGCNTAEHDYDDGDCCYKSCTRKIRRYPCGFTGFQCKENMDSAPSWFRDIKFCFKWRASGDGTQCDNAGRGKLCAPIGSMTRYYYDDTDQRNGGCILSWKIEARTAPSWFWTRLQLCLYTHSDGDVLQCNYGTTDYVACRRANYWLHYADDTDNRPGGCIMRWKALYRGVLPKWMANARFCFYWRSTGGQCGMPGQPRQFDYDCVPINSWTAQYRDDTDARNYGCEMAWGILL